MNEQMISFIEDFEKFIDYLSVNEVTVGKQTGFISPKFLFAMNEIMSVKEGSVANRSNELSYPLLHLFSNLVKGASFFRIEEGKSSKIFLKPTEYLEDFKKLKITEKYIFLLETLWVECNFQSLRFQTYDSMEEFSIMSLLSELKTQKANERLMLGNVGYYSSIIKYLFYFGILTYKESNENKPKMDGRFFTPNEIKINSFGLEIVKILNKDRSLEEWNKEYRRNTGEWDIKLDEEFYLAFVQLFEEGQLTKTIVKDRMESRINNGIYTFKISLNRNNWCKIRLSSHHTFEDLHNCIQKAFDFDNDHMYSFFMDGRAWSNHKITCPYDDEGPHVDEIKIKEYPLYAKQKFLYLFDYGDEWRFEVEVFDIEENKGIVLLNPEIIEIKGKVEQY